MPERSFSSKDYRYGFNGKEKDESGEWGDLTHYDYGFRIYNPGVGRFLSVDPLSPKYPELTPYQFASNTPIWAADLDGLEAWKKSWWRDFGDAIVTNVQSTIDIAKDVTVTAINNPHKVHNLTFLLETKTAQEIGSAVSENPGGVLSGAATSLGELAQDVQPQGMLMNVFREDGGRRHGNATFELASAGAGKAFSTAKIAKGVKVLSKSTPGSPGSGNLNSGFNLPPSSAARRAGRLRNYIDNFGGSYDISLGTNNTLATLGKNSTIYKRFHSRGFTTYTSPNNWGKAVEQAMNIAIDNGGRIKMYLDDLTVKWKDMYQWKRETGNNGSTMEELKLIMDNPRYKNATDFYLDGELLNKADGIQKVNELGIN